MKQIVSWVIIYCLQGAKLSITNNVINDVMKKMFAFVAIFLNEDGYKNELLLFQKILLLNF